MKAIIVLALAGLLGACVSPYIRGADSYT